MIIETLSDAIIYGSLNDVAAFINAGAPLNEIDDYGYSPLVQTAIMNDIEKAKLVIDAGADINFADLTGRTALHWAADNNNDDFCKLLLDHGANPNAYTTAGQPILTIPVLRDFKKIKTLLRKKGASLTFAQDFINAKLLGHRFQLKGQVDITDPMGTFIEIDYEGFYLEFTLALILNSLINFRNNYAARNLRHHFEDLQKIIISFTIASELIQYQHYNIDVHQHEKRIDKLLNYNLSLIPVAYMGHAITFIKYGPLFARVDRGEYGKKHGSVIIYEITKQPHFSKELIKELLYKRQSDEMVTEGVKEYLGLRQLTLLPISLQISGNCSWANVEAAVPTMIFLLALFKNKTNNDAEVNHAKNIAMSFYQEWLEWDKRIALNNCIDGFNKLSKERQASKVAILNAILFQSCNPNNPKDREKIIKILPYVTNPEFSYVLKSYVQTYYQESGLPIGKKFINILDDFGVDVGHL